MKYIITEDKFDSLFTSYLNKYDWKVWDYSDNEISVYDGFPGRRIFYTVQYNDPWDGTIEDEFTLRIDYRFADELRGMFGKLYDPWKLIDWFNKSFNTNCVTWDEYYKIDDLD